MSTHQPSSADLTLPVDVRVAVLVARFNSHVTETLLAGCVKRFKEMGLDDDHISVNHVPGAFELPVAALWFARTRKYEAIVCLGCVIRGDTPHFDYVAGEAARGIRQVALSEALPVIFGVLTTHTEQQALDRAGGSHGHAGISAASAAAEMILLQRSLHINTF